MQTRLHFVEIKLASGERITVTVRDEPNAPCVRVEGLADVEKLSVESQTIGPKWSEKRATGALVGSIAEFEAIHGRPREPLPTQADPRLISHVERI